MPFPPTYKKVVRELTRITKEVMETGIYLQTNTREEYDDLCSVPYWKRAQQLILLHEGPERKYVRQIVRELKRPFIHVTSTHYREYAHKIPYDDRDWAWRGTISFPRQRRTRPLASALLLIAAERPHRWGRSSPAAAVNFYAMLRCWSFHFHGEEGKQQLDNWLHQCKTNPEFRKALGLLKE